MKISRFLFLFTLLWFATANNAAWSQGTAAAFPDQALARVKQSKAVIYLRERTLLVNGAKDTNYRTFRVYRYRVSDISDYHDDFFKIVEEGADSNRTIWIKDSTGSYTYARFNKQLLWYGDIYHLFPVYAYPYFETFGLNYLRTRSSVKVDSTSDPLYLIYSTDSSELVEGYTHSKVRLYQDRKTKLIVESTEEFWFEGIHQYQHDRFTLLTDKDEHVYDSISLRNTDLIIRIEMNGNSGSKTSGWNGSKLKQTHFLDGHNKVYDLRAHPAKAYLLALNYKARYPCDLMTEKLNQMTERYGSKGILFLGLHPIDKTGNEWSRAYGKAMPVYQVLFSEKNALADLLIDAYPALVLVDENFVILDVVLGYDEKKLTRLEELIRLKGE